MNLKGRHFLTLKDYTPEEIQYLVDFSAYLKDKKKKGILVDELKGKNVALIFEKTSTRTRCSFEVAAHDLGIPTLTRQALRLERKKALLIQQEFSDVCTKGLSTADSDRKSWKNLPDMPVSRYGTD